jgi:hypothetical protein
MIFAGAGSCERCRHRGARTIRAPRIGNTVAEIHGDSIGEGDRMQKRPSFDAVVSGTLCAACALTAVIAPPLRAQERIVNVSPVHVDYGAIKVGASVLVPVTIRNLTSSQLQIAGGGFNDPGAFSALGGNCNGGILPANGSCSINYYFRPTAADETFTANTTISAGANGVGSTFQSLSFAGAGTESLVQVSPLSVDFGTQQIGATVSVPFTFTNTHDETIQIAGGGGVEPPFGGDGGDCNGGVVAAGVTCHLNYRFTPSSLDPASDATGVGISATGIYETYAFGFAGAGAASAGIVTFSASGLDFGEIKIGRTTTFDIVATNLSAETVSFAGGGFNDDAGGAFGGSTNCGSGLDPGDQCFFRYRFQPRVLGEVSASTSVSASIPSGDHESIALSFSGTGIGTLAQVTPVDIDFGQVRTGTNMTVPVTVTNTSEAPLTGFLGGDVSSPFSASNTCPASLAVGASCEIDYRFQPGATVLGRRSTTTILSFTNTTGVRPNVTITLSGIGYDPDRIFIGDFD